MRVLKPAHRHWGRTRDLSGDHRLVVVAVAVRPHQPADLEALETLGEVRDHVTPVHLAVDEDVEADLLLAADPFGRCFALELLELRGAELAPGRLRAGLREVLGLPNGAGRRR